MNQTIAGMEIIEIDTDALQPNPLQVRNLIKSESLVDLVESIKEHGLLEPLVVLILIFYCAAIILCAARWAFIRSFRKGR